MKELTSRIGSRPKGPFWSDHIVVFFAGGQLRTLTIFSRVVILPGLFGVVSSRRLTIASLVLRVVGS